MQAHTVVFALESETFERLVKLTLKGLGMIYHPQIDLKDDISYYNKPGGDYAFFSIRFTSPSHASGFD